jgi:hypothetical protein
MSDIANNVDFVEMLKLYQSFFNLNATGKLDMDTVKQMLSPRCGMPDIFHQKNPRTNYVGRTEDDATTTNSPLMYKKEAQKQNAPSNLVTSMFSNQISLFKHQIIYFTGVFIDNRWRKKTLTYKIKNGSPDMRDSDIRLKSPKIVYIKEVMLKKSFIFQSCFTKSLVVLDRGDRSELLRSRQDGQGGL